MAALLHTADHYYTFDRSGSIEKIKDLRHDQSQHRHLCHHHKIFDFTMWYYTHTYMIYNNGTLDSIQVQWKECDYYTGSTNTQVHWNSSGSCGKMSSCTKHELEKKKGNKYTWSLLHHYYYYYIYSWHEILRIINKSKIWIHNFCKFTWLKIIIS